MTRKVKRAIGRGAASVAALTLALAFVACGAGTQPPSATKASPNEGACGEIRRAAHTVPTNGSCLAQALVLSGDVSGNVQRSVLDQACDTRAVRGEGLPSPVFHIVLVGQPYSLMLVPPLPYDHGPVVISASDPHVRPAVGNPAPLARLVRDTSDRSIQWTAAGGTITYAEDASHGSVDLEMARVGATSSGVRIGGNWRCGSPPLEASPDPTSPCGRAFVGVGLEPDQVALLRKGACVGVDLSLQGDVSGHADHAVGLPTVGEVGATYPCGGDGAYHYTATIGFGIEDETLFLAWNFNHLAGGGFGPIQPGTYGPTYSYRPGIPPVPAVELSTGQATWAATTGQFTIGHLRTAGTIDMDFVGESDPTKRVHVAGNWSC